MKNKEVIGDFIKFGFIEEARKDRFRLCNPIPEHADELFLSLY